MTVLLRILLLSRIEGWQRATRFFHPLILLLVACGHVASHIVLLLLIVVALLRVELPATLMLSVHLVLLLLLIIAVRLHVVAIVLLLVVCRIILVTAVVGSLLISLCRVAVNLLLAAIVSLLLVVSSKLALVLLLVVIVIVLLARVVNLLLVLPLTSRSPLLLGLPVAACSARGTGCTALAARPPLRARLPLHLAAARVVARGTPLWSVHLELARLVVVLPVIVARTVAELAARMMLAPVVARLLGQLSTLLVLAQLAESLVLVNLIRRVIAILAVVLRAPRLILARILLRLELLLLRWRRVFPLELVFLLVFGLFGGLGGFLALSLASLRCRAPPLAFLLLFFLGGLAFDSFLVASGA